MTNSPNIALDTTWTITDGKIGMVSQALGLAEAVGLPVVEKTIRPAAPWKWFPPGNWPSVVSGAGAGSDPLVPPLPRLIIGCGRHSIRPALWIKEQSQGRSFAVHIQHPRINPARFDLVVAPDHDRLTGPNVLPIRGSLHRVTRPRLDAAASRIAPTLAHLPRPLVAVLVGGSNSVYTLTDGVVARLAADLSTMCTQFGAGLMVTPSRRTGKAAERQLREGLADAPAVMWDGNGENPYLGYLGIADAIVVTCDSVNMMSEACATGKPVYIVDLDGKKNSKFRDFREMLTTMGIIRPFEGALDRWSYAPLNETARVAEEIRRRLGLSP